MDVKQLFSSFNEITVGVVGDVMLDTYWWGKVDRISPEAPVPVVAVNKKEQRIGGAANVALNLASLGANVASIGVVGQDDDALVLKKLLEEKNINTRYLVTAADRTTTNKIRIISRNQQMMRLDVEQSHDVNSKTAEDLLQNIAAFIAAEKPRILILEDYNKGVLTPFVIKAVIALCKREHVLVAVDPKRKNFFEYKGVDIFKPNFKETVEGLNVIDAKVSVQALTDMHVALKEQLQHQISFITLSEHGVFYATVDTVKIIPTHVRSIADVSGAGDTVIAVASLVYAASKDAQLMAEIANIAGGLVCEEVGTVAINKEKLLVEVLRLLSK